MYVAVTIDIIQQPAGRAHSGDVTMIQLQRS